MTTPLVLQVLHLNEKLETLVLGSFKRRLTWNSDKEKWSLEKSQYKLLAFNIVLYFFVGFLSVGPMILLLLANQFYSKCLSLKLSSFGHFTHFLPNLHFSLIYYCICMARMPLPL